MRILCIHAHYDDYEFVASGTFELWKRRLGDALRAKLVVCTDGRAGHHIRSVEETARLRLKEQEASAAIGQYEFEQLRDPAGQPFREACLLVDRNLLAALWKCIRDFEPDYLFCPPLPTDPLAGVHVDHVTVAEAIRKVAYMTNVPHAFIEEYPNTQSESRFCKTPVIINTFDAYMAGANAFDIAVNVESTFDLICRMTWCHQTQIMEWLPWVGRHEMEVPNSFDQWCSLLRKRFIAQNRQLGIESDHAIEAFRITSWGVIPTREDIERDFPELLKE